jgi:tetratricopeptide (TPR) repeat protein
MIREAKMKYTPNLEEVGELNHSTMPGSSDIQNDSSASQADKMLTQEIEAALTEYDVTQLRSRLHNLLTSGNENSTPEAARFNLLEETDLSGFPDQIISGQELFGNVDTLPKIHLNNHHRNGQEVLHQEYKQEFCFQEPENMDLEMDAAWMDIESGLSEKDIMSLRDTLVQIGKGQNLNPFACADMEAYLEGDMRMDELEAMDAEIRVNPALAAEISLLSEVDYAIAEQDVIQLRNQLKQLSERETSTPFTLEEIEYVMDGDKRWDLREQFADELSINPDLQAELNLIAELDAAFNEPDITELRASLRTLTNDMAIAEEKSFMPDTAHFGDFRRLKTAAAIMVMLLGISLLVRYAVNPRNSLDQLLQDTPDAMTTFRSAMPEVNSQLYTGFEQYNNADFSGALLTFQKVLEVDGTNAAARFYTGASHQHLENFERAVSAYNQVISHKDNLFVEQAEWYMGLCLVQLGENDKAGLIFEAIISREGFYAENAASLLKKMKR